MLSFVWEVIRDSKHLALSIGSQISTAQNDTSSSPVPCSRYSLCNLITLPHVGSVMWTDQSAQKLIINVNAPWPDIECRALQALFLQIEIIPSIQGASGTTPSSRYVIPDAACEKPGESPKKRRKWPSAFPLRLRCQSLEMQPAAWEESTWEREGLQMTRIVNRFQLPSWP